MRIILCVYQRQHSPQKNNHVGAAIILINVRQVCIHYIILGITVTIRWQTIFLPPYPRGNVINITPLRFLSMMYLMLTHTHTHTNAHQLAAHTITPIYKCTMHDARAVEHPQHCPEIYLHYLRSLVVFVVHIEPSTSITLRARKFTNLIKCSPNSRRRVRCRRLSRLELLVK